MQQVITEKKIISDSTKKFLHAINDGDLETIESYVSKNRSLLRDNLNDIGDTALLCAARAKRHKTVIKLLQLGAHPSDINNRQSRILHFLAFNGASDCINYLIKNHSVVFRYQLLNKANKYHNTPLHEALMNGHKEIAQLLLDHGASPLAVSNRFHNILHFAVIRGYKDWVERYIDDDRIDWALADYNYLTILHYAAKLQDTSILKFLLSQEKIKKLKDWEDFFGRTPLQVAVEKKNDDAVRLLGGNLEVLKQSKAYGLKRPMLAQSHIMPQVKKYFKQAKLDTSSYNEDGHCFGLESSAGIVAAHFNLDIFYHRLNAFSLWDKTPEGLKLTNKLLDASDVFNNTDEAFEYTGKEVFFFQKPPESYSGSQEFTDLYQTRQKTTSDTAAFKKLFAVPFLKNNSYTPEVFAEYMAIVKHMPGELQVKLSGHQHATRLFLKNNSIRYYEPNGKYQFAPFATINKVVDCVKRYKFQLLGHDPRRSYIDFTVYAVHNPPSKPITDFNYFSQDELPKNKNDDIAFQKRSPHDLTFLHIAVLTNSLANFKELINKSFVDPFKQNKAGQSAIDWIVRFDHLDLFGILVRNLRKEHLPMLIKKFIAQLDSLKTIFLLRKIPDTLLIDNEAILTYAFKNRPSNRQTRDQIILFLVKQKGLVDTPNANNEPPLFMAIKLCVDNSIIKLLLNSTQNIHVLNNKRQTLLHCAAEKFNSDIVKLLLESKIDVNHQDCEGKTVLHYLVTRVALMGTQTDRANKIFHEIIKTPSIDFSIADKSGWTAFDIVRYACNWEKMTTFLEYGATVSSTAQTLDDTPLLFVLIKDKQWKLLGKCLQQSDFDIITPSYNKAYAIHYLAGHFCEESQTIADQFLIKDNIHCKTETGLTALDIAVFNKNQLATAYFTEKGLTKLHERTQKKSFTVDV